MPNEGKTARARAARRLGAVLVLGSLLPGCAVRRELSIRTEPPGVQVRFDDRLVGETPLRLRFQHYGSRRITLYKEGYRTRSTRIRLRPPWYLRFPLDLVTEVLLPFGWRDHRRVTLELSPQSGTVTEPDFQLVRARAERIRRAGPEGPGPLDIPMVDLVPEDPEPSPDPTPEDPGPIDVP